MIDHVEKLPSPRCIKTHLPIQFLPDQIWTKHPKMIYVKRNFKDMAVSYCHLYEGYRRYSGSMEIFMNALMGDYLEFSPYFPHIKNYCDASKVLKNFMVLNYEDMAMVTSLVLNKNSKIIVLLSRTYNLSLKKWQATWKCLFYKKQIYANFVNIFGLEI